MGWHNFGTLSSFFSIHGNFLKNVRWFFFHFFRNVFISLNHLQGHLNYRIILRVAYIYTYLYTPKKVCELFRSHYSFFCSRIDRRAAELSIHCLAKNIFNIYDCHICEYIFLTYFRCVASHWIRFFSRRYLNVNCILRFYAKLNGKRYGNFLTWSAGMYF